MKTAAFFEKRSQPTDGRFFRELPGRADGQFLKLSELASSEAAERSKTSAPDPTFLWDEPVADGYHRPAREQSEALEYGGERFHASDADRGTQAAEHGPRHPPPKHHKHAAARFWGTPLHKAATLAPAGAAVGNVLDKVKDAGGRALQAGKDAGGKLLDRVGHYGGQALDTLKGSGEGVGERADEFFDAASRHPAGAAAMIGGAGVLGAKAVGGAARGVASVFRKRPKVPKGLVERGLAGLSHLLRK